MNEQEGVLSRWSRRKQQTQQENVEEDQLIEQQLEPASSEHTPPVQSAGESTDADAQQAEPVLTDADMPDIDSLNGESDFSGFMSPGVSDELRNRALRKLFSTEVFNIRDGLDEYDEDYTSFESLGSIVTCDMKHQIEMEAQKNLQQDSTEPADENAPLEAPAEIESEDATATEAVADAPAAQQQSEPSITEQTDENTHEQPTN